MKKRFYRTVKGHTHSFPYMRFTVLFRLERGNPDNRKIALHITNTNDVSSSF